MGLDLVVVERQGWLTNGGWRKIHGKQGGSDFFYRPNNPKPKITFTLLDFFL